MAFVASTAMRAVIIDETQHISARMALSLRQAGYVVEVARSAGEARWILGDLAADVVVLCAAQPGNRDAELVDTLRADGVGAAILVLHRTGCAQSRVAVLDAGADDVVTSPLGFEELAARMRALTRRGTLIREPALQVGDLVLDPDALTVHRHSVGEPIELTARQVVLLRLLMRSPGQVLTRAAILDAVWGLGAEAGSNVVDQLVSQLRAKIDRPYGRSDIQTIRGVGYRLVDTAPAAKAG